MGILKESLKLPMGKGKLGCEAGVVAMTTKAEEMWMKAGIQKQSCAGPWRKGQILGKKVELVAGRQTQNTGKEFD